MVETSGSLSVLGLGAAPSVPTAINVVEANVCSLPGVYIEDEGVLFKNNIFLT